MKPGLLRVFGLLVIAHGLSHVVLAFHESLTGTLWTDAVPLGVYTIGMIGFVSAGLGLIGVAALDAAISPLLVLASGLSLIAIIRFADAKLWLGAACDVLLLVIGLWRGYHGWPAIRTHGRSRDAFFSRSCDGGIFHGVRKNPQVSLLDSAKTP